MLLIGLVVAVVLLAACLVVLVDGVLPEYRVVVGLEVVGRLVVLVMLVARLTGDLVACVAVFDVARLRVAVLVAAGLDVLRPVDLVTDELAVDDVRLVVLVLALVDILGVAILLEVVDDAAAVVGRLVAAVAGRPVPLERVPGVVLVTGGGLGLAAVDTRDGTLLVGVVWLLLVVESLFAEAVVVATGRFDDWLRALEEAVVLDNGRDEVLVVVVVTTLRAVGGPPPPLPLALPTLGNLKLLLLAM